MSAPYFPQASSRIPSSPSWQVAHRHTLSTEEVRIGSAEGLTIAQSQPQAEQPIPSQMFLYKKLIETIVQHLMKEGLGFIEAYDEVLLVGRLNPFITAKQLPNTNPTMDRKALLEFKAHNAILRLQHHYDRLLMPKDPEGNS